MTVQSSRGFRWILSVICIAASGFAAVYDDFSSGDLSEWTYTPASTSFEPTVVSNALVWGGSTTVGWKGGSLVSTETGFDLSSQPTSIVQVTVSEIVPRDSSDTSFDAFGVGWQAENGDVTELRYNWHADSTNNNAAFQMRYTASGGSTVVLGATAYFGNFPIENGDILKLVYLRDDNRLEAYRERSGTETLLFGRTAASLANLSGNARIYLARNDAGYNSSVTLDDIATSPAAVVGGSHIVFQDTFSIDGSLAGRPVEVGFGTLWQAHADMLSSNGVAMPGATAPAKVAALPFVPESGNIYSLSADINSISGSWVALGFLSETNTTTIAGNGYFQNMIDEESPWMYTQPNGNVATFTGPAGTGTSVYTGTGSNGTFKIVLNTTLENWTAVWYYNDAPLRTNVFSGSLNINFVGFGAYPIAVSEVDNFTLVEESALAGYALWSANWGVDIGSKSDDYDGDGLSNLFEYGVGGDPTSAADTGISSIASITKSGGTNWLTYVYPALSDSARGIGYYLEVTDDLLAPAWTNAGYVELGTGAIDGDFNAVTNVISTEDKTSQFVRLVVEEL